MEAEAGGADGKAGATGGTVGEAEGDEMGNGGRGICRTDVAPAIRGIVNTKEVGDCRVCSSER